MELTTFEFKGKYVLRSAGKIKLKVLWKRRICLPALFLRHPIQSQMALSARYPRIKAIYVYFLG